MVAVLNVYLSPAWLILSGMRANATARTNHRIPILPLLNYNA